MLLIDGVIITLRSYNIEQGYIQIPRDRWHLFPDHTTTLRLETDRKDISQAGFYVKGSHHGLSKMTPWFRAHHDLMPGDKVRIKVAESMKRYRLEIVK